MDSLVTLAKLIFPHYASNDFAPMHFGLSDILMDSIKSKVNKLIILPRGFAKSTFTLLFFLIWVLIFTNKKFILMIGESKDAISKHFVDKVAYEIEHNKILKALGIKKGATWKVSKDECSIDVLCPCLTGGTRTVRIEAKSFGQSLRGLSVGESRPDLILIDDLERQKSKTGSGVESPAYRAEVKQWFFSEIIPIGGGIDKDGKAQTQIIMLGTIMHEDQLLMQIFNEPMEGAMKFDTVKKGYLYTDEKGELCSLWPDRQPVSELLMKKDMYFKQGMGNQFANEWLSEIQDSRNQIFKQADFRYYFRDGDDIVVYKNGENKGYSETDAEYDKNFERRIPINSLLQYVVVDPAVSEDEANCDSGIGVIGVSDRREWFILDMQYGKWRGNRLWEEIFKANAKYNNIYTTGIEGVGYQKAIPDALTNMMRMRGTYFKTQLIKNNGQEKFSRIISALEWRYIQGKIFHDLNAKWTPVYEEQAKRVSNDGTKGLVDLVDTIALGGDLIKGAGSRVMNEAGMSEDEKEYRRLMKNMRTKRRSSVV